MNPQESLRLIACPHILLTEKAVSMSCGQPAEAFPLYQS